MRYRVLGPPPPLPSPQARSQIVLYFVVSSLSYPLYLLFLFPQSTVHGWVNGVEWSGVRKDVDLF